MGGQESESVAGWYFVGWVERSETQQLADEVSQPYLFFIFI